MSRRRSGPSLGFVVVLALAGLVLLLAGLVRTVQGAPDPGRDLVGDSPPSSATSSAPRPPSSKAPSAGAATDPVSGLPWVATDALPPEARDTLRLIDRGGPYPEVEDGGVFGNFEGILPDQPHGYYSEYTVQTPGEASRGARRIVAGDGGQLYWTADHYRSFARIRR